MEILGIVNVASITVIVYIIGLVARGIKPLDNKWIPAICGVLGMILGVVAYTCGVPDYPAQDILTAIAVGGVSGLAATGIDQAVKQLHK